MQRKIILACISVAGVLLLVWLLGGQGASAYQAAFSAISTQEVAPAAPVPVAAQTNHPAATRHPVTIIPPPAATSIPPTPATARDDSSQGQEAPTGGAAQAARVAPAEAAPKEVAPAQAVAANRAAVAPAGQAADTQAAGADAANAAAAAVAQAPASAPATVRTLMDPAAPASLNGVPLENILIMSDDTLQTVRSIYAQGQRLGRDPNAFAKIGDSTMAWPPLLDIFSDPAGYRLGPYEYLRPTVTRYNSAFGWTSAAVKRGMHSWSEFDPTWVTGNSCKSGETPIDCELRLHNPSVAIIRLGANDAFEPTEFDEYMRQIVGICVARGVIPVLGTKPDRREGPDNTINKLVVRIAEDYGVPLWDYDRVAATVPGKGLLEDGIHYRGIGPHDYSSSDTFANGDSLEDLTALMMLDAVTRAVNPIQSAGVAPHSVTAQN
jgi:hypothetical protein